MVQKCQCGSRKFKASITLELQGVPVLLKPDGSVEYDDVAAEHSDGWDTSAEPEISCVVCEAVYNLELLEAANVDGRPTYELRRMDMPPRAPGRDEQEG